ncbi:MAG: thioesterase family protein [Acidobacteria bacterium]|nr:thioesterase family protein [Acidobacteriota bacterium]
MPLFERDGPRFVPTGLTRGPWDPNAMNGGAVAALVARAAELHEDEGAPILDHHLLARLTIDLVRPAPLAPLTVRATTLRPGRKIQLVEVLVEADDQVVTRASALRMPAPYLELEPTHEPSPAGPEHVPGHGRRGALDPTLEYFHVDGVELRAAEVGERPPTGDRVVWIRLAHPVVEGEAPSPAVRAAAAADFGSGMSSGHPPNYRSINTDISVHLFREPVGDWICYQAKSRSGTGVALAGGGLYDQTTRFGRASQTVLVEPWPGRPSRRQP